MALGIATMNDTIAVTAPVLSGVISTTTRRLTIGVRAAAKPMTATGIAIPTTLAGAVTSEPIARTGGGAYGKKPLSKSSDCRSRLLPRASILLAVHARCVPASLDDFDLMESARVSVAWHVKGWSSGR